MGQGRVPWAPPLVEPPIGAVGHLPAWEKNEADGAWWAGVPGVQEAGGRHVQKVVQVRAASVRPLEPLETHQQVLRRGAWP